MKKIIIVLFITMGFSSYNVGDSISDNHLNQEFELCYSIPGTSDNIITLNDYNGNINGGDYHVLVIDMSATWCGPCQRFKPIMQEVANEGHSVQFIDIDSQEDLARQYNVRSVPTVVIEQNGSEVNRLIGASTKEVILENLS